MAICLDFAWQTKALIFRRVSCPDIAAPGLRSRGNGPAFLWGN